MSKSVKYDSNKWLHYGYVEWFLNNEDSTIKKVMDDYKCDLTTALLILPSIDWKKYSRLLMSAVAYMYVAHTYRGVKVPSVYIDYDKHTFHPYDKED